METLQGRVAVVTGAGSGIGRGLATALAAAGAHVVLADIEPEPLAQSVDLVRRHGVEALAVETDVSDADSVEALAAAAVERFDAVHILCNNAGVGGGGAIANQQLVDWQWVLGVNLWGVVHGVHHFLPHLLAAPEAHIMSTASVAGLVAGPGLGPYNASKFGVVAIMETLHHELAITHPHVGVSVLCPGVVRTNIVTSQRNRPAELARASKHGGGSDARSRNAAIGAAVAAGQDPQDIAAAVLDAMVERRFWVLTHPEHQPDLEHRSAELLAGLNPTVRADSADVADRDD